MTHTIVAARAIVAQARVITWRCVIARSCIVIFTALACSAGERQAVDPLDCSVAEAYEFRTISDFSGTDSGWFLYGDPTPGGVPDPLVSSNVEIAEIDAPGRCDDTRMLKLEARGHNFWGAGFGDWAHNSSASRADGTGYDGVSFWVRSAPNTDKSFLLRVDEGRTIVLPPETPDGGVPVATPADEDLDEDGYVGPGDIARGTQCRLPPPEELGKPACYNGGVNPPGSATRVPAPDECGNFFHTVINTTDHWRLVLIPWNELVQWPCPNRLEDGINPADIAKFEIRLVQGSHYEIWIDNIAFYRRRSGN
jgi:hypothetical protein